MKASRAAARSAASLEELSAAVAGLAEALARIEAKVDALPVSVPGEALEVSAPVAMAEYAAAAGEPPLTDVKKRARVPKAEG